MPVQLLKTKAEMEIARLEQADICLYGCSKPDEIPARLADSRADKSPA